MERLRILLITTLLLAGCGSSANVLPLWSQNSDPVVYHIGVLAPLDNGQVEFGRGIRNGAQLAVNQWNDNHFPDGPFFELEAFDDSSSANVGLAAARVMVELPALTGVVGSYNSGVAAAVLPTFQAAGIAMVSPGNTDPALTLGPNPSHPVRPYTNYFRLVVPDTLQGPALAEYAFAELELTRVAVVSESKSVSQGLARAFSDRFVALGGTLLTTEVVPEGTSDYSSFLSAVALTQPQLVFYAGEVPNASLVREQAAQLGLVVPLMGGDGMKSQVYIDDANASTEGDVASSLGAPAELLPSAASFLADYQAAGFADPAGDFGPYAFDAANLLIRATVAGRGDRGTVLAVLENVDEEGATGRLSFDAFGDTLNKLLTINVVRNGVFLPEEIVTLAP